MNLYIRKHTFSENYTNEYFFNFFAVLEKDISQALTDQLIIFFDESTKFREEVREKIHPTAGIPMVVVSQDDKNYGYTVIGFVDHEDYKNIFLNLDFRQSATTSLRNLYNKLGWEVSNLKKISIDGLTYNSETQKYENLDASFENIEQLFNQATEFDDE